MPVSKYYSGDEIKENEMVGYIARVGNRRNDFGVSGRIIKERYHFELKTYA